MVGREPCRAACSATSLSALMRLGASIVRTAAVLIVVHCVQTAGCWSNAGGYFFGVRARSGAPQPASQPKPLHNVTRRRVHAAWWGLLAASPHTAGKLVGVSTTWFAPDPGLVLPACQLMSFPFAYAVPVWVSTCRTWTAYRGIFCLCGAVPCSLVAWCCWQRLLAGEGFVCVFVCVCVCAQCSTLLECWWPCRLLCMLLYGWHAPQEAQCLTL